MPDTFRVETTANEGLFALLIRAEKEASRENTPVGVLVITRERRAEESGELVIEAALAHEGGLRLRRIDVKVTQVLERPAGDDVLSAALEQFGGTAFTNVCVEQGERELFDVTVAFPARLPIYARNSALIAADLAPGELELAGRTFLALGVAHRPSARTLRVRARDLRRPMQTSAQLAAFRAAASGAGAAQIYCSVLPPTRSLRLMQRQIGGSVARYRFESVISRGMARATLPIGEVTEALEKFATQRLGARFAEQGWAVENIHGERMAQRRVGVFDERREISWSVNWGHSRR